MYTRKAELNRIPFSGQHAFPTVLTGKVGKHREVKIIPCISNIRVAIHWKDPNLLWYVSHHFPTVLILKLRSIDFGNFNIFEVFLLPCDVQSHLFACTWFRVLFVDFIVFTKAMKKKTTDLILLYSLYSSCRFHINGLALSRLNRAAGWYMEHMSHEKKTRTVHWILAVFLGSLFHGLLESFYRVGFHPLYTLNNQGFVQCSRVILFEKAVLWLLSGVTFVENSKSNWFQPSSWTLNSLGFLTHLEKLCADHRNEESSFPTKMTLKQIHSRKLTYPIHISHLQKEHHLLKSAKAGICDRCQEG